MENLTSQEVGVVALFALIGVTGVILIALAWYVVQVIANWKIFKKMGEPGWKSIIAALIIEINEDSKLSKSFGHGAGFTVGLVFLNPIFKLILGFGSSQYVGNTTEQQ